MLFDQIVKEVIPNADESITKDEVRKKIQEIALRREDLNGDWVRAAVTPTNKAQ